MMKRMIHSTTENYQLYVPESAQVGKAVGKIKANDDDLGVNAEMTYRITNSEGASIFDISTDGDKKEGVILLKKVPALHTVSMASYVL